jgi:hypothetical protein
MDFKLIARTESEQRSYWAGFEAGLRCAKDALDVALSSHQFRIRDFEAAEFAAANRKQSDPQTH